MLSLVSLAVSCNSHSFNRLIPIPTQVKKQPQKSNPQRISSLSVDDVKRMRAAAMVFGSDQHKYKQQLYCYKLLVEHSHTFAGYTVNSGRLEFLEPDENGKIQTLPLPFQDAEMQRIRNLLKAMWSHVMHLDFPDTSDYSHNLKGTLEFEDYLLGRNS